MLKRLDNFFHYSKRGANIKSEIIGGILTFISVCFIMPVNASILSHMGMSSSGVFTMTAITSALVTLLVGLTNYPVILSASMSLNGYLTYTIALGQGYSWNQTMILLTISGILFFVISMSPIRRKIIEDIPKDIKYLISVALGAFICFVGLKSGGIIISSEQTFVSLGSFKDPALVICLVSTIFCLGILFCKNKFLSTFAIPIAILLSATAGCVASSIMIRNGSLSANVVDNVFSGWIYKNGASSSLPVLPWVAMQYDSSVAFGLKGANSVLFYGLLDSGYSMSNFSDDVIKVLITPQSYIFIFLISFITLFDSTATLVSIGHANGMLDSNDKFKNYHRVVLADSVGALISGPLGTSTVIPLVESNVGVSAGAKTGISALISGSLFLLSAFIYPVFYLFTAGSVTAPALISVGAIIFASNIKHIRFDDTVIAVSGFIGLMFTILCYSISDGIGFSLITYCVMMICQKRAKEVKPILYIISGLFIIAFVLTAL